MRDTTTSLKSLVERMLNRCCGFTFDAQGAIAGLFTGVVHGRITRLSRTTDGNNETVVGAHGQFVVERLPLATKREIIENQETEKLVQEILPEHS